MAKPPSDQQPFASTPPTCPVCNKTMRLFGRESHPDGGALELLTFSCSCGQITTSTTPQ